MVSILNKLSVKNIYLVLSLIINNMNAFIAMIPATTFLVLIFGNRSKGIFLNLSHKKNHLWQKENRTVKKITRQKRIVC